jgi:hypothetical protein
MHVEVSKANTLVTRQHCMKDISCTMDILVSHLTIVNIQFTAVECKYEFAVTNCPETM